MKDEMIDHHIRNSDAQFGTITDTLKPGDLVYLKSGSPKMVVLSISDSGLSAVVMWNVFGTSEITQSAIPIIALRKHT